MKNLHIIPTDKETRLYLSNYGKELNLASHPKTLYSTGQHIYITSDEEIKEDVDQWYLDKFLNKPRNSSGSQYAEKQDVIILTTDQDLIKDGIQAIDDDFLEWFVKNPSCEEVETYSLGVKNQLTGESGHYKYEIIIPKEEPKQETIEEAASRLFPAEWDWKEKESFIEGAEWKAERSYSEEEVMDMFHNLSMHLPLHYEFLVKEQFKKK